MCVHLGVFFSMKQGCEMRTFHNPVFRFDLPFVLLMIYYRQANASDLARGLLYLPFVQPVQFFQPAFEPVAQVAFFHAPSPVAADFAGKIHAAFGAQAEEILQRGDGKDGH